MWSTRIPRLSLLAVVGCAGPHHDSAKIAFSIDPPSRLERTLVQIRSEGPTPIARIKRIKPIESLTTHTEEIGNVYTVRAHGGLQDGRYANGVETIEGGLGGPLSRGSPAVSPAGSQDVSPAVSLPSAPEHDPSRAPERSPGLVEREDPILPNDSRPYLVMQWPLPATGVTSLFGERTDPLKGGSRFHFGVDLQGEYGQLIQAVAPGRVLFAGWNEGHGRRVIIEHLGGWRSSYSHLAQTVVQSGDSVVTGQGIGQMGNSGRSTGPHLHLEITRWGSYHDPLDLLGKPVPIY